MTKLDPVIAVKDVEASTNWYRQVFGFRRASGAKGIFAVLVSENDEIILCLHKWEAHEHPAMKNPEITPGNGLILYLRTQNMNAIRQNIEKTSAAIEEETHLNSNSLKHEFSLRDPDGYYITITEFHKYEG